jgi:hypothetical protein
MTSRTLHLAGAWVLASVLMGGTASALAPGRDGDFVHTPATEQKAHTPLPIYLEYPGAPLGRVIVKYAGTGVKTWSRIEMKHLGAGWGVLIPCGSVTAGTMRYWIQGFDENGEAAASSGDPKHPFVVPIREELSNASNAPHLPGRAAPQTCSEDTAPADEAVPAPATPPAARSHAAHEAGELPAEEAGEPTFARWWVGVSGAVDFLSLPSGSNLCKLTEAGAPANPSGDYCTNPDGSDFPVRTAGGPAQNTALVSGKAGQLTGGLAPGDLRAMIAVDYAVTSSILIGGRLGYVVNSYPTSGAAVTDHHAFGAKVHVEARATYVFGDDPLGRRGFEPAVFAALGISEFDGHAASFVTLNTTTGHPAVNQPVNVWVTNGPWFVAVGGGARYQFSQRAAFTGALRVNAAFGGTGALLTYGPEIGFQYGF